MRRWAAPSFFLLPPPSSSYSSHEDPRPLQPPSLQPPPIQAPPPPVQVRHSALTRSTTMARSSVFPSSSTKPSARDHFPQTTESLGGGIPALGTWVTMARTLQEATMTPETMSSLATQWPEL